MAKSWPKATKVKPPKSEMECSEHGDGVRVIKLPDEFPDGKGILSTGWGCVHCVAEFEHERKEAEREKREKKEAERRKIREAKRAKLDAAKGSDETLRLLSDELENVRRTLPTGTSLRTRKEAAEERLSKARWEVEAAEKALQEARQKLMEATSEDESLTIAAETGDTERARAETALRDALRGSEAAWSEIPRIKRKKHRDRQIRIRARRLLEGQG